MGIDAGFRLSTTITLSFACACLAWAELPFIPLIFVVAGPVIVLQWVAYFADGRWSLSIRGANVMGVLMAIGTIICFVLQVMDDEELSTYPLLWSAALVPALGPLVMLLILAKMYRPLHQRDYWLLHGLGLMEVCLAAVLATDPMLAPLLACYLFSVLWSLGLFYLERLRASSGVTGTAGAGVVRIPWRALGTARALRWVAGALFAAVLFFLITPPVGQGEWNPLTLLFGGQTLKNHAIVTGASEEIDLNSTGTVDVDEEVALTVFISDDPDGNVPKTELPGEPRWRTAILDSYGDGRWQTATRRMTPPGRIGFEATTLSPTNKPGADRPAPSPELFDLGPGQFYILFRYDPRKVGAFVLAEPALLPYGRDRIPVVSLEGGSPFMTSNLQGTLMSFWRIGQWKGGIAYKQVTRPLEEGKVYPPLNLSENYLAEVRYQPVDEIKTWTEALLRRLAGEKSTGVTSADCDRIEAGQELDPERQEIVANALCNYLTGSGEFSYTLDRPRQDTSIDPTVDFLVNVKEGHCERFATGLALMLRSAKVPARVIKGYRGADSRGDGNWDIRHSHAHAWVEALVWQRDNTNNLVRGWLMLDPTPSGGATAGTNFSLSRWLRDQQRTLQTFWSDFIVNYSLERQEHFVSDLWDRFSRRRGLMGVVAVSLLGGVGLVSGGLFWTGARRARRLRPRSRVAVLPVYARLLTLLDRRCQLRPTANQTPREFAAAARKYLVPFVPAALADLPDEIVTLFYRVRYGTTAPEREQVLALEADVGRLSDALRSRFTP